MRVPVLSLVTDTTIYLAYGNPSVTVSQENKTGVWDSNFRAVYHMADKAANTTLTDSTGRHAGSLQANTSTKNTPGEIGGALSFNGSNDYAVSVDNVDFQVSNVRTVSMWVSPADLSSPNSMRVLCEFQDANNHWALVTETPTSQNGIDVNTIVADIVSGGVETRQKLPNNSLSAGNWYYLTVNFNGSVPVAMYLNGQSVMTPSLGQNYGYGTAAQMNIGSRNDNGHLFSGVLDEIRFSNIVRSGDWIAAEYNNQSRPASFYAVTTEGGQQQVASPTFSVAAGTYGSTQSVAISTTTVGASIRYTMDGSTPSSTVGTVYSGPIAVSATTTLKAIAYLAGWTDSAVNSAAYTIAGTVATPTFSPAAGTYASTQSVAISSTTVGASIRYTMDGSTPSSTVGTVYSGPIAVSASTTLKAIAYLAGWTDSAVNSAAYTIAGTVATPTFSPAAGTYASTQSVAISTTTVGASIRYTTDGSTPSSTVGTVYSGPIAVSATTTLKAIAYLAGWTDSAVNSAAYTITGTVATPTFSPAADTYASAQTGCDQFDHGRRFDSIHHWTAALLVRLWGPSTADRSQ